MENKQAGKKVNFITTALHQMLMLFAVLFIITLPFSFPLLPAMPASFLKDFYQYAGNHIFYLKPGFNAVVESDSAGMYMQGLFLLLISFLVTGVFTIRKKLLFSGKVINHLCIFIAYYLALHMLVYGFNKIFKWQFYLPEPNTLYTTVGNTRRDLMYWSTMGVSRAYNIFTGGTEVIIAVLLLFRRTRIAGACGGAILLLNIIAVNFAYDISVKLLSCFLFLLSSLIIWPQAKNIFSFFFRKEREESPAGAGKYKRIFIFLKAGVILLIFCSAFYPYCMSGNFNDDKAARPKFHGAYDVSVFIRNSDTLLPLLTDTLRWRRVFIHRKDYFIIQKMNDEMYDFEFAVDTAAHQFISKEFLFDYREMPGNNLLLSGIFNDDPLTIVLNKIDLKKLPLLQNEFHWTGDE